MPIRVVPSNGRLGAPLLALGFACMLAGCDAAVAPIEVAPGCPGEPLRGPLEFEDEPPSQLIDDFEDGDTRLALTANRDGSWIIGSDTSGQLTAENSPRCAARGARAGHFAGAGFENWGANWTAVFRRDDGGAVGYDATRYSAISFWAARGPNAQPPHEVPVGLTTLDVAWNGGVCTVCMDFYRTVVTLSPEWQRIVVPFESLRQEGKGEPLTELRVDELVGFIVWPTHQFDVWIDDVRFEP